MPACDRGHTTMAVINTQGRGNGTSATDDVILPTDVYRMKIAWADIEEDRFAEPNKDGTKPEKLVMRWEVSALTPEQQEQDDADDLLKGKVWQRINPYYGPVKDGGVSKFKAFIDSLVEQGFLEDFDPTEFDTEDLVELEQRVSVEHYIKGQGPNAGQPGNKVVSVMPLKRKKTAEKAPAKKKTIEEDEDLPF